MTFGVTRAVTNLTQRVRRIIDEPRERFGLLLCLLIIAFAVNGFDGGGWMRLVVGVLNLTAVVVAFTSTGLRVNAPRVGAVVAIAVVGSLLLAPDSGVAETSVGAAIQVVVLSVMTLAVLGRVLGHREVTNQTLLGAIAAYFLIGQLFAWIYMALPDYADGGVLAPTMTEEIPMYYSYVVLTTLGFGDVVPLGDLAERVTVIEALIGQLFLAILVARLVAMYARPDPVGSDTRNP